MAPGIVWKFPTNVELDLVTQEYTRDKSKQGLGQRMLPNREVMTQEVQWDEKDNETGMTAVHNMDTDPFIKQRPGSKTKSFRPIAHKESEVVKESELLNARQLGTLGGVINIDDLVMERFGERMNKDFIRQEWECWQCLQGNLAINENGVIINEAFPIQIFTPSVLWDTVSTATPLKDLNAIKLLFRGTGASAQGATVKLNQGTFNKLLENTNPNDLRGFNVENFRSAAFDIDQFNKMLTARGLPNFEIYDEGYYDDAGLFQLYIPNGKAICVGKRPAGQPVGNYILTPTLHRQNGGQPAPGFFAFITVNGQPSPMGTATVDLATLGAAGNPKIAVTSGFYGGPVLYYPRSIVKINAY